MALLEITAADLNVVSFGDVYGHKPLYSIESFAAHVYKNQIDLVHSLRMVIAGELFGVALLAFRGTRSWVGGFGVAPRHRSQGFGQQCAEQMLKIAHSRGLRRSSLRFSLRMPPQGAYIKRSASSLSTIFRFGYPRGEEPFETSNSPHTLNRKLRGLRQRRRPGSASLRPSLAPVHQH